jgi:hypothetical protein
MKQNCAPLDKRQCPDCEIDGMLNYYKEDEQTNCDLYFCKNCFGITIWDGKRHEPTGKEAYPNRDKQ